MLMFELVADAPFAVALDPAVYEPFWFIFSVQEATPLEFVTALCVCTDPFERTRRNVTDAFATGPTEFLTVACNPRLERTLSEVGAAAKFKLIGCVGAVTVMLAPAATAVWFGSAVVTLIP